MNGDMSESISFLHRTSVVGVTKQESSSRKSSLHERMDAIWITIEVLGDTLPLLDWTKMSTAVISRDGWQSPKSDTVALYSKNASLKHAPMTEHETGDGHQPWAAARCSNKTKNL